MAVRVGWSSSGARTSPVVIGPVVIGGVDIGAVDIGMDGAGPVCRSAPAVDLSPNRWTSMAGARQARAFEAQPVVETELVVVVVVVGAVATVAVVATSGPRITTMSAVPIELIGAAVV